MKTNRAKTKSYNTFLTSMRAGAWRGLGMGIGAGIGLFAATLAAVTVSGTINTFAANTSLNVSQFNENFTTLQTAVNNLPLGTYCGMTAAVTGTVGGYVAANALCATACNDSRAHMCTSHEMAMSLQNNVGVPTTVGMKVISFTAFSANGSVGDCRGWTSDSGAEFFTAYSAGQWPQTGACSSSSPLACCL